MRVINFHDGEDDNIYVETDDMLSYYITQDAWHNAEVPDDLNNNPIAKATYLLHYSDCFVCISEDNQ